MERHAEAKPPIKKAAEHHNPDVAAKARKRVGAGDS